MAHAGTSGGSVTRAGRRARIAASAAGPLRLERSPKTDLRHSAGVGTFGLDEPDHPPALAKVLFVHAVRPAGRDPLHASAVLGEVRWQRAKPIVQAARSEDIERKDKFCRS